MGWVVGRGSPTELGKRGRPVLLVAGCLLALAIGACGGGEAGESSSGKKEVLYGLADEQSGSLQVYGIPARVGVEAAADSINADGGISVGGEEYRAGVTIADNRSDPSAVASSTQKVIGAGAIAALGPAIAAPVSYNLMKNANLITFTADFGLETELEKNAAANPLLFSVTPFFGRLYSRNMKQVAARFPEIKTVAILSPANDEGKGAAEAYAYGATEAGMKVVAEKLYPEETTDFSSTLTSIKGDQPDLLIALQSTEQALTIMQQANQLSVTHYMLNDTVTPDQVLETSGLESAEVIIPNFSPTFSPEATIPAYDPEELFGDHAVPNTPGAAIDMWYSYRLLAQAIEEAGTSSDAKAIAEKLPGQSYDGPFGRCSMTEEHEMQCETLLETVSEGTVEVERYPRSDAVEPSEIYICRSGDCKVKGG